MQEWAIQINKYFTYKSWFNFFVQIIPPKSVIEALQFCTHRDISSSSLKLQYSTSSNPNDISIWIAV